MRDTSSPRCQECFQDAVLNGTCTHCGAQPAAIRRDRRALPLWTVIDSRYRVGKVLGAGGFGITYIAEDVHLGRRVALKEYFPSGLVSRADDDMTVGFNSHDDEAPFGRGLDRFFREGKLLAKFDHPNIVRVHEVFRANGTAYLAMEYLDGMTLKQWLAGMERVDVAKALQLIDFVLEAVRAVHDKDIVHRDIKPDNIYITNAGRVLLLDFGGAKQLTAEGDRSMDAMFAHGYAAPEQYIADSGKVGPWTDVYGAAATLYRMLAGEKLASALERHSNDPPLDWHGAEVPMPVRRAVAKAVSLKQSARFQTIADFEDAMSASVTETRTRAPGDTRTGTATGTHTTGTWDRLSRHRTKIAATAAVVAGAALLAWWLSPPTPPATTLAAAPPTASAVASTPTFADARTRKILNDMLDSAERERWSEVDASALSIRPGRDRPASLPPQRSALHAQAAQAIGNGEYDFAAQLMRRATAEQPEDAKAWSVLGYAELRLQQPDEARNAVANGLALAADNATAWATMAELLAVDDARQAHAASALRLAVYFSRQRAALLEQLKTSDHVAPQLKEVIRQQGGALDRLPKRAP